MRFSRIRSYRKEDFPDGTALIRLNMCGEEQASAQGSSNSGGLYLIFSSSHLLIFTPSHLHTFSHIFSSSHLLIFTSAHLHIFSSSHLLIFTTFSSSHLLIFTSSHLHICSSSHLLIFTSSYLHIFSSSQLTHLHILTPSLSLSLSRNLHTFTYSLSLSPLSSLLSLSLSSFLFPLSFLSLSLLFPLSFLSLLSLSLFFLSAPSLASKVAGQGRVFRSCWEVQENTGNTRCLGGGKGDEPPEELGQAQPIGTSPSRSETISVHERGTRLGCRLCSRICIREWH